MFRGLIYCIQHVVITKDPTDALGMKLFSLFFLNVVIGRGWGRSSDFYIGDCYKPLQESKDYRVQDLVAFRSYMLHVEEVPANNKAKFDIDVLIALRLLIRPIFG